MGLVASSSNSSYNSILYEKVFSLSLEIINNTPGNILSRTGIKNQPHRTFVTLGVTLCKFLHNIISMFLSPMR